MTATTTERTPLAALSDATTELWGALERHGATDVTTVTLFTHGGGERLAATFHVESVETFDRLTSGARVNDMGTHRSAWGVQLGPFACTVIGPHKPWECPKPGCDITHTAGGKHTHATA